MDGFGVIGTITSDELKRAEKGVDRMEASEEGMALFLIRRAFRCPDLTALF